MTTSKIARLYRPSPPETFPEPDIIAMLDAERNIVFFRQDLFDKMSDIDQSKVYRMNEKYLRFAPVEPEYFKK